MSLKINIEEYNIDWPKKFDSLKEIIWPNISDVAIAMEHVGSTSVPSLAAKPVIDIDIVVENVTSCKEVTSRLHNLGYVHLGDLGVPGR